jgi:hypothetical protein
VLFRRRPLSETDRYPCAGLATRMRVPGASESARASTDVVIRRFGWRLVFHHVDFAGLSDKSNAPMPWPSLISHDKVVCVPMKGCTRSHVGRSTDARSCLSSTVKLRQAPPAWVETVWRHRVAHWQVLRSFPKPQMNQCVSILHTVRVAKRSRNCLIF